MNCPTCSASVHQSELIMNVATLERFCLNCASRVCPSFLPYYVLTTDDCAFLRACGINPEVAGIEDALESDRRIEDEETQQGQENYDVNRRLERLSKQLEQMSPEDKQKLVKELMLEQKTWVRKQMPSKIERVN
jgi:hypothetical protein